MEVIIVTDKTSEEELRAAAEIIAKLRYNTKDWERHYGSERKNRKKLWEIKADLWIDVHIKRVK